MGGCLRTLSYKEAWAVAWKESGEKQREWYLSLPNFDAQIFFEITGIETRKECSAEPSLSGQTVKVEIGGKTYTTVIQ